MTVMVKNLRSYTFPPTLNIYLRMENLYWVSGTMVRFKVHLGVIPYAVSTIIPSSSGIFLFIVNENIFHSFFFQIFIIIVVAFFSMIELSMSNQ